MSVHYHRDGSVAYVELDNPPVNAIGLATRQGLADALDWIESQSGLTRVILSGKGRAFAAGADAREFDKPPVQPHLPEIIARIETSFVPWIAAVDGVALGGGCELVLGCRYRIASPRSLLGLPEVTLGVVPGAGGTQRLPRLIGLEPALGMIATGRPVSAARAAELGLIDEVDEDPLYAAEELNGEHLDTRVEVSALPGPEAMDTVVEAAKSTAAKKMANQIAPIEAIDLVAGSVSTEFTQGLAQERETFIKLRQGEQARALRHIFFAERSAKKPESLQSVTVPKLSHCVVVGGGTMGAGIAYALLNAGIRVTILETDSDGVERARDNVAKIISASLDRGLIDETGAVERRDLFTATDDYGAAADADLAIEAAFESMKVKQEVFSELESVMRPETVLATNTSYLDINEIAAGLKDPARLVGLHFFAPAHIMKLLEIISGDATSPTALGLGFELAKRLRKVPVLAGVCDGFIGNRIYSRYREAADTILMDGSTPWEIDEAMVEFGYAMGPYETQDLSGLDIAFANRRRQDATRDPNRRYIPIGDRMVELGKLGRKTGAGWYRYPGGGGKVDDPIVADLAIEEAYFAKITRRDFTASEIRHRLLLAMINEAADILHEGIAQSARDIDLVTVFGYGFPRWRGGLMHYADTIGAVKILADLQELAAEDSVVWQPSPIIREIAATGFTFADWKQLI